MSTTPTTRRAHTPKLVQLTFSRRGGARPGAGRKPMGLRPLVPHVAREPITARQPVLVTLKLRRDLPSLRRTEVREVLLAAFRAGGERHGLRWVHYAIQSNHVHALVEARDAQALSRGMLGLAVRLARALNRLWKRRGSIWIDRFHSRALRTPREVRNALAYVMHNACKHGVRLTGIDPYSSGSALDGWAFVDPTRANEAARSTLGVARARSWLLTVGWKRHGLLSVTQVPGPPS